MAKHLYETLGVSKDAPPDEVRKAYRKAALKTHPDRLPPGSSEKDKQRAGEQFRKVNNAYEVLSDEGKRGIYDRYGEFPPPEVQQDPYADHVRYQHRHRPHAHKHRHGVRHPFNDSPFFNDPFFTHPFGSRSRPRNDAFFGFTDPFALFNQMFGDMRHEFEVPFFGNPHSSAGGPLARSPFGHGSLVDGIGGGAAFGMLPQMNDPLEQTGRPFQGQSMSFQSSSRGVLTRGPDGSPQWVSQSKMTRAINGVTESVWKRTDSNGNEHVTYSYPDGRERYLINGVEQPSGSYVERNLPPPPPYSGPPAPLNTSRHSSDRGSLRQNMKYAPTTATPPTGPYSSANIEREREDHHGHHGYREHKHRHNYDYHEDYDDRDIPGHHKKRWWKGEW